MRQSRRRRGFDPRYRQFYGLFGRCQVSVRVRVRKKVHGERTEAMLEKKKNWSVFMVLRLPNPKRNKGAGVIPVALCLTYGGQVIVSLVTQDFLVDLVRVMQNAIFLQSFFVTLFWCTLLTRAMCLKFLIWFLNLKKPQIW